MTFKISVNDSLVIKGLAILLIIFHNYFHWLSPRIGENQFSFNESILTKLSNYSITSLIDLIQFSFTYFGHYGVQLFIFLSGYGLTKAYGIVPFKLKPFLIKRITKIYITFTFAIIVLLIYNNLLLDNQITLETLKTVFFRLSLVANWIPERVFSLTGPFWFYSMIVQLYLCFPILLLINRKHKYGLWVVLILSFLFTYIANPYFLSFDLSLYYNFIGNLPVFVLGVILAYNSTYRFPKWLWVVALIIFILGQFNNYLWHFSPMTFVLIAVPAILFFNKKIRAAYVNKIVLYVGSLSMYLFAVNGFLRKPWIGFSNNESLAFYTYLYFLIFLICVFIMAILLQKIEKIVLKYLDLLNQFYQKDKIHF